MEHRELSSLRGDGLEGLGEEGALRWSGYMFTDSWREVAVEHREPSLVLCDDLEE